MTASAIPQAAKSNVQPTRLYSVEEYIKIEIETNQKHIYKNGIIIPMAGGKSPHGIITGNVFYCLKHALRSKTNYDVFNSEIKVHIPAFNFYLYPDTCAVCESPVFTNDAVDALTNPVLIVEVLSGSTRKYDEKGKFEEYKTIPSFKEYVLIEQNIPFAKVYYKGDDGIWQEPIEFSGIDNQLWLESVQVALPMSEVYLKVVV
jgi:Uma2 family endonuclease